MLRIAVREGGRGSVCVLLSPLESRAKGIEKEEEVKVETGDGEETSSLSSEVLLQCSSYPSTEKPFNCSSPFGLAVCLLLSLLFFFSLSLPVLDL